MRFSVFRVVSMSETFMPEATVNQWVAGSSPAGGAKQNKGLARASPFFLRLIQPRCKRSPATGVLSLVLYDTCHTARAPAGELRSDPVWKNPLRRSLLREIYELVKEIR